MRNLEVALLPAEALSLEADCYVVIDALRATTTIATLFSRGLSDLVAVDSLELAQRMARREERLLLGEVNSVPPRGFHGGNSPVEMSTTEVEGKGAILFTTNGTRVLCALAERGSVLTGAMSNASALVETLAGVDRVVLVCAGNELGTRFALEDLLVAGIIAEKASDAYPGIALGDATLLAMEAAAGGEMEHRLAETRHAQGLAEKGFAADLEFAAQLDTSEAVPAVVEYGDGWARLIDFSKS
jgi:2-phosphosulfolactate phosphatase